MAGWEGVRARSWVYQARCTVLASGDASVSLGACRCSALCSCLRMSLRRSMIRKPGLIHPTARPCVKMVVLCTWTIWGAGRQGGGEGVASVTSGATEKRL